MDISSSNYYSVGGSTNKGMPGLASGMDTENMVKQMLSGTQSKIDKQQALKTQAEWKQTMYREIIGSINGFKDKYFDTAFDSSLTTNMAKADFFNSMVSSLTSGSGVRVLATRPGSSAGDTKVVVDQLAKSSNLTSTENPSLNRLITGSEVDPDDLTENLTRTIKFKVDGTEVKIDLNQATTNDEIITKINDTLASNSLDTKVEATMHEGRLRLVTKGSDVKLTDFDKSSANGIAATGMAGKASVADATDETGAVTGKTITFAGQVDADKGPTFTITLDGVSKQVTLKGLTPDSAGEISMDNVEAVLKEEVEKAFGESVEVGLIGSGADKKITLGIAPALVRDSDGHLLERGTTTKISGTIGPGGATVNATDYRKGKFYDIDGNELVVTGNPQPERKSEVGHQLTVTGSDAGKIGLTAGASTAINGSTKLSDLGLSGDAFAFKINGQEFAFKSSDSISTVMNRINTSSANVRMSYSALADTFKIEATSTGSKYDIEIEQTQGDLLTKLFGDGQVKEAGKVASTILTTGTIGDPVTIPSDYEVKSGASFRVTVDGVTKNIVLPYDEKGKTITYKGQQAIIDALNVQLRENFYEKDKYGKPVLDNNDVKRPLFKLENDGTFKILPNSDGVTPNNSVVQFAATTVDMQDGKAVAEAKKTDLALLFGFNEKATSNIATADTAIKDVIQLKDSDWATETFVDGTETKPLTLAKITPLSNGDKLTFQDGRLIAEDGNTDGEISFNTTNINDALAMKLFGDKNDIVVSDGKASGIKAGQDAKAKINGIEVTRSSNTFEVDGLTLELTKVSTDENVINVKQDTDKIVKGMKEFVEDYNKLLESLNGYVDEDRTYRKYPPLTADQRKEMSDKEVELWEEKAKEGLLHRESDIDSFLSSMRLAMYAKPSGSNLALYDIGIDTTMNHKDKGKLSFNETKLREALSADPQSIMLLFTSTDGIASKALDAIKTAANLSSGAPGALVSTAGIKGMGTEKNNLLTNDITRINDRIKTLQAQYERERQRYWNQFNSMESTLSNLNNQSSYFTQQFG